MAQGKLKVKSKVPNNKKVKKTKGSAVTKRANRPSQPKKKKLQHQHKIKQTISKMVNKKVEDDIRGRAAGKEANLSAAQQAVAKHNAKSK